MIRALRNSYFFWRRMFKIRLLDWLNWATNTLSRNIVREAHWKIDDDVH